MKPVSTLIPALLLLLSALASPPAARAFDGCRAADVDDNGIVNIADAAFLVPLLGSQDPRFDLDGSRFIAEPELQIILSFFESGCLTCPGDLDVDGDVDADDRAWLEADFGLDCRFDTSRDGSVTVDRDVEMCLFYLSNPISPATPRCDFDGNGVNIADILEQIQAVGRDCRSDLNKDGLVNTNDVFSLLSSWGACPESP